MEQVGALTRFFRWLGLPDNTPTVRTKNSIRVEAGRKSWETRRAREAAERAARELNAREPYFDHESDAVDVG